MEEQTGDVRFGRSAFGGFNRRDVIDYIDKLQRSAAEKDGDAQALAQIMRERDELEQENHRLREQITQLRAHLRVEQTANELLDEKLHKKVPDESFLATAEPVSDTGDTSLSLRDVDEMVQKYFG